MLVLHRYFLRAALFFSLKLSAADIPELDEDIFLREERCAFCLDDTASLLVGFPCLHQCLCGECAFKYERMSRYCPICRQHLEYMTTVERLKKEYDREPEDNESIIDKIVGLLSIFNFVS